ncbi:phosphopantetheine-binding protein [Virgibacillus sp. C22-A2]|uniref:Phosphopantetheine-binding protein n=1 Tax=Virgibacillus tibetensis TaxID=3042313 RepID=A0ABU6KLT3_9BACI|nr:phosphopantetheine-binding protein [Virgibacillus sp. C22-A2]
MSKEKLLELIIIAIKEVLDIDKEINQNTRLFEELDIDSTSIIELLMALEDNIPSLYIDPEELNADDFESIGSLVDYTHNNIKIEKIAID